MTRIMYRVGKQCKKKSTNNILPGNLDGVENNPDIRPQP